MPHDEEDVGLQIGRVPVRTRHVNAQLGPERRRDALVNRVDLVVGHKLTALPVVTHHVPDHAVPLQHSEQTTERNVLSQVGLALDHSEVIGEARAVRRVGPIVLADEEGFVRALRERDLSIQQRDVARLLDCQRRRGGSQRGGLTPWSDMTSIPAICKPGAVALARGTQQGT